MRPSIRFIAVFATAGLATAGCGGELPVENEELTTGAIRYEAVAGDQQQALPGAELPNPLVVRVLNAEGLPIAGQIVNWVVTEGGGAVFAGTGRTNPEGLAQEWWTLGPLAGSNVLEARAVDSTTGEALVFARFQATATEETPQAPAATLSLSALGYKVKGLHKVDLQWSGATTATVDLYRDDALLTTTANDGQHLDPIDRKGGGVSYRYRLCEAGGSVCSAEVSVTF